MSQHGVFQVVDTFTFQVDAEQESSELFSHGAVNAATTSRADDHAGELIYLQVRLLPQRFCCFQLGSRANTCCSRSTEARVTQFWDAALVRLRSEEKGLCWRGDHLCPRAFSVPYVLLKKVRTNWTRATAALKKQLFGTGDRSKGDTLTNTGIPSSIRRINARKVWGSNSRFYAASNLLLEVPGRHQREPERE